MEEFCLLLTQRFLVFRIRTQEAGLRVAGSIIDIGSQRFTPVRIVVRSARNMAEAKSNPAIDAAIAAVQKHEEKVAKLRQAGAEPAAIGEAARRLEDYNKALTLLRYFFFFFFCGFTLRSSDGESRKGDEAARKVNRAVVVQFPGFIVCDSRLRLTGAEKGCSIISKEDREFGPERATQRLENESLVFALMADLCFLFRSTVLDAEMLAAYEPQDVELVWNDWWEAQGYYKARDDAEGPPFVMVIPPPNVTGQLHIGHALTVAVEDTLVRWYAGGTVWAWAAAVL
jgi:hypothetical protein